MSTRNIVPRADSEGNLGTTSKKWSGVNATSVNELTLLKQTTGFTITGGTTSKTLTVDETVALSSKASLSDVIALTIALGG
jgi:hypothetical protein